MILPCTRSTAGSLNITPTPFIVLRALQVMLVLVYCVNAVAVSVLSLVVSLISLTAPSMKPLSAIVCSSARVLLTSQSNSSALTTQWKITGSPAITLTDSGGTSISFKEENNIK